MLKWLLPGRQNGNMKYRIVPTTDSYWCLPIMNFSTEKGAA